MIYWTPVHCNGWCRYFYQCIWSLIFRSWSLTIPLGKEKLQEENECRPLSPLLKRKGTIYKNQEWIWVSITCLLHRCPGINHNIRMWTTEHSITSHFIITEDVYPLTDAFTQYSFSERKWTDRKVICIHYITAQSDSVLVRLSQGTTTCNTKHFLKKVTLTEMYYFYRKTIHAGVVLLLSCASTKCKTLQVHFSYFKKGQVKARENSLQCVF